MSLTKWYCVLFHTWILCQLEYSSELFPIDWWRNCFSHNLSVIMICNIFNDNLFNSDSITFYKCNISMPIWFVEILILWTWLTLQPCIILHIINILTSFSGIDWIISKESFRFPIHIIRMLMLTLLCSYVFGRKTFSSPTVNHCKPDHPTILCVSAE